MELQLQIKMNPKLYLRDPDGTDLGRNIIKHGIQLIHDIGFEDFTFKKLAIEIGTTEASIYRYFENKHRLLTYITTWFWTWLEYQLIFHTNNLKHPKEKIDIIIRLLTFQVQDKFIVEYINKSTLHAIVICEGDKSYLTKQVTADNKSMLFKPYKDLCHRIAEIFLELNPDFPFSHSLASTLIETAHRQLYFKEHLPSLTDFGKSKEVKPLFSFLQHLIFTALNK
ncbi:TetR/AcrR family transcriptional regulator [Chitinophaga silvatica]|uniref:TetR/AcrR family transcriptional regulator n=1 Tax=Chitinophaga silvatica TaxID=2282649 RepID=A0A3E1YH99_9BACT|nr:TetR/AcrR family transcriptional regulator [Chitinophaga silvatica]RFS26747.1 TetR/AcrR family transcriptional regulator [Chitinophaga silvatica]